MVQCAHFVLRRGVLYLSLIHIWRDMVCSSSCTRLREASMARASSRSLTCLLYTSFAVQFGHDESFAAGSVVLTTLLSIVALPLCALVVTLL